jgi:uncharacterized membrane protein
MQLAVDIFLYLIIYSFLGWCCETTYCSFGEGHFINRGFLNGPFCPIYGFGSLVTIFGLEYFRGSVLGILLGGILLTSTLEYITGWGLEKIFHTKWWDYSKRPYNVNGRVCLKNSILFGILCLFLNFIVHPFISKIVAKFSLDFKSGFLFAFLLYFAADIVITVRSVLGINNRLAIIGKIKKQLLEEYNDLNEKLGLDQFIKDLKDRNISNELTIKLNDNFKRDSIFESRLLRAFPHMTNKRYGNLLNELKLRNKNK